MKLHWSSRSPFVRKVMVLAHEVDLVDRIELVSSTVAMTKPNEALMRDNPLSRIPTLITDDGLALYESTLICEYLDSLHAKPKLLPSDPVQRWPALRWHALGEGMLEILVLWRNEQLRPEPQRSPEMLAAFKSKTRNALDLLEREAGALACAPFSLGHIGVGCALGYLDFRFAALGWRTGRPQIAGWFGGFAKRASYRATMPVE
jgi:glutathione S-transferase